MSDTKTVKLFAQDGILVGTAEIDLSYPAPALLQADTGEMFIENSEAEWEYIAAIPVAVILERIEDTCPECKRIDGIHAVGCSRA